VKRAEHPVWRYELHWWDEATDVHGTSLKDRRYELGGAGWELVGMTPLGSTTPVGMTQSPARILFVFKQSDA
jgi:hypothetical protein